MEAILDKINELGQHKNLIPAEQVIMTTIREIDPFLKKSISDDLADKLFSALLSLYSINKGEISMQCGIYIASKIIRLFEISQVPKFWDIINMSIETGTQTSIISTGFICRKVGVHNTSQLPRFIEYCLKIQPPNYATIYAIRSALKAGEKIVSQFSLPTYELLKKFLPTLKSNCILISLKLLRTLLKIPPITVTQILDCVNLVMKHKDNAVIKNEISLVIARCAYLPFSTVDIKKRFETSEWSIGVLKLESQTIDLESAFLILSKFTQIFDLSVDHFLNLLGSEMISMNHLQLFNFIRAKCPEVVKNLIPMLPADLRFSYFREVSNEPISAEQLKTLTILSPDDGCINETAGIALLLATSDDKKARNASLDFFSKLATTHPLLALPYLHSSLVLLAQPPERNPRILRDLKGNATVAITILNHLPDAQTGIMQNQQILDQLLSDVFKKPRVTSYRFIFSFALMSYLPPEQVSLYEENSKKAVDFAISYFLKKDDTKPPKMTRSLLKSIFSFRSKFQNEEQNKKLLDVAISFQQALPFSVISDLCQIIQKSPLAFNGTKLILDFAASVQPSVELVNEYIKRPLPTSKDLVCVRWTTSYEQAKHDRFLRRLINRFPSLVDDCSLEDQKKLIAQLMKSITTTYLLILMNLSDKVSILPPKFPLILLKHLENKNAMIVQCVSECIARHLSVNQQSFIDVMSFALKGRNQSNCILLNSIFNNMQLSAAYINQSLLAIDALSKNVRTMAMAIHALSSLLMTHQMQLSSVKLASNQFSILYEALNTPTSLQPLPLHMMGECYGCLIEAFSSEIKSNFTLFIELILRTIESTPTDYAREVYFESSQAIYTFANSISYLAPLYYPQSRSSPASLQLTSCAAYSDYLKFLTKNDVLNINIEELVPKLLALLQRTSDERASNFFISLAALMKEKDISFWIATIKRVLITCSLLKGTNFTIEPTPEVKETCLKVATCIVPNIANEFKLHTEHLDDLISSVCRATETDRVKLQEAAFPTLEKVISLFKGRITDEGQRILDLYDSQFSMAVKVGFDVNLSVSGGFLINYLTFNTDNMDKDPENCSAILVVYLDGLNKCQQRTESYFSIATHLCTVARKYPPLCDLLQRFLTTLSPIFFDLVTKEMQLWNPSSDWRTLSHFRSLAQSFYAELLPAFVWLQKVTETSSVDIEVLVSFILLELTNGKENWIMHAAFEALPVAIDAFGSKLSPSLLTLSIQASKTYYQKFAGQKVNKRKLSKDFNDFSNFEFNYSDDMKNETDSIDDTFLNLILVSTRQITADVKYDEVRENLMSTALNDLRIFSDEIFANLIQKDERNILSKYSFTIFEYFLKQKEDEIKIIALVVLLFSHSPSVINSCICSIMSNDKFSVEFRIEIVKRGLLLSPKSAPLPLEIINRFCIKNFKKGAMHMIGLMLVKRSDIGLALLADGAAKASFLLSCVEKGNCRAYLRFIQLSLHVILDQNSLNHGIQLKFAKAAAILALNVASKFGSDMTRHGHQILLQCICILNDAQKTMNRQLFEASFSSVASEIRTKAIQNIVFHIRNEEQRKKADQLVEFSTNERGKRQMEWQTLEIEGEDD